MRALWSGESTAFDGKWVKFPAVVCRPTPAIAAATPGLSERE